MNRIFILCLILACLLVACSSEEVETTQASDTTQASETVDEHILETEAYDQLPRGLEGNWVSASVSDRGYSESITFNADGTLSVDSLKNGKVENSIYGKFYVEGNQIIFEITNGTTPYKDYFDYVLDGRELQLIDDDGPAHYLRTS